MHARCYGVHPIQPCARANRRPAGRTPRVAFARINLDRADQEYRLARVRQQDRDVAGAWRTKLGRTSCHRFDLRPRLLPLFDDSRRIVAQVRDGKPVQTYDPYEALYDWPLFVGKSWVSEFRIRDYVREQTVALKYEFRVEVFEEVATPGGIFKSFRIRRDGPDDRYIVWFNPELGVEVKRVWERFSSHRLGPGTNEMELDSYNIK